MTKKTGSSGMPLPMKADVVIVGAGPIGLAEAWGLKKLNPDLKIVVLEKYEEFQRKHTLVMQPKQLKALMLATDSMNDPKLQALLKQLRKNPNIRTNVIQEIFKEIAVENGVKVKIEEVKTDTIEAQLRAYNPKLIIGADGTHSVVNAKLFPKDNLIKHNIDYAMQVRLEIDGDVDKNLNQTIAFYQRLALHGLIATEQVGRPDPKTGKTPVTMQIIIPKEDYELLNNLEKKPNAKDPIKPFTGFEQREIPPHLQKFIDSYLAERLEVSGSKIDANSIRISVNELPATRVRQAFTHYQNEDTLDAYVSLGGDAESALSYFKGYNAGLERLAKYFKIMKPAIEQGLTDKSMIEKGLSEYQTWFSPYADKKINEVKQYSTFKVRSGMKVIKAVKDTKSFSAHKPEVDKKPLIDAYYQLLAQASDDDTIKFKPYPHRAYNPEIQLGQFSYVSLRYTFKKIGKIFIDFFKPYKATYQLVDDLKQPFTGIVNVSNGIMKMIAGFFTLNIRRFIDGAATLFRGIIELITLPLVYTLKLITRGLITAFSKSRKIEENKGMQKLVTMGEDILDSQDDEEQFSFYKMQSLLGICNDLHRKFDKSNQRGQKTNINSDKEKARLKALTADINEPLSKQKVRDYFKLFTCKNQCEPNSAHQAKPFQSAEGEFAAPAA